MPRSRAPYRKLAKKYHPDLNPGDKKPRKSSKEVNEANDVLSDPQKRQRYDQFGFAGVDPNYAAANGGGAGGFRRWFWRRGPGRHLWRYLWRRIWRWIQRLWRRFFHRTANVPRKGHDIQASVILTFEEAAHGCSKKITINRQDTCPDCGGTGAAKGTSPETCPDCGRPWLCCNTAAHPLWRNAEPAALQPLRRPRHHYPQPVQDLPRHRQDAARKSLEINIPAGIDDEQNIALRGQAMPVQSGGRPAM